MRKRIADWLFHLAVKVDPLLMRRKIVVGNSFVKVLLQATNAA